VVVDGERSGEEEGKEEEKKVALQRMDG